MPAGWEPRAGQQREPLGNLVKWVPEGDSQGNHVIRFTIPKIVAENEGVMYYSLPFPVEEGATYRFQCRWRSTGPQPEGVYQVLRRDAVHLQVREAGAGRAR